MNNYQKKGSKKSIWNSFKLSSNSKKRGISFSYGRELS